MKWAAVAGPTKADKPISNLKPKKEKHMSKKSLSRTWSLWAAVVCLWIANPTEVQAQEIGGMSFVEIHGYADLTYYDYEKEGDPDLPFTDGDGIPTFDNNHLTLFFGANLSSRLRFISEFHYEHSIEEPELPQASIQWKWGEPLTVSFGRFWFPFGMLGKHKIYQPTNGLVSYPYTISHALPFHYADNGVKLHGSLGKLSYEAAVVNGFAGLDEEAGIVLRGLAQDNNQNKRVVGRIGVKPIPGLELGGSYTTGKWDDNNKASIQFWGVDGEMKVGPLTIHGEYVGGKLENPDDAVVNVNGTIRCNGVVPGCVEPDALRDNFGPLSPGDHDRTAYYLQLEYRLLNNQMNLSALDLVARYDAFERDETNDAGDRSRVTVGINLSPEPHFHLKAEYQKVSETGDQANLDNDGVMFQAVVDF